MLSLYKSTDYKSSPNTGGIPALKDYNNDFLHGANEASASPQENGYTPQKQTNIVSTVQKPSLAIRPQDTTQYRTQDKTQNQTVFGGSFSFGGQFDQDFQRGFDKDDAVHRIGKGMKGYFLDVGSDLVHDVGVVVHNWTNNSVNEMYADEFDSAAEDIEESTIASRYPHSQPNMTGEEIQNNLENAKRRQANIQERYEKDMRLFQSVYEPFYNKAEELETASKKAKAEAIDGTSGAYRVFLEYGVPAVTEAAVLGGLGLATKALTSSVKVAKLVQLGAKALLAGGDAGQKYHYSVSEEEYDPGKAAGISMFVGGITAAANTASGTITDKVSTRTFALAEKVGLDDTALAIISAGGLSKAVGGVVGDTLPNEAKNMLIDDDYKFDSEQALATFATNAALGVLESAIKLNYYEVERIYTENQNNTVLSTEASRARTHYENAARIFNGEYSIKYKKMYANIMINMMQQLRKDVVDMNATGAKDAEKEILELIDTMMEEFTEYYHSLN